MQTVYILIGAPGCGKTSWALQNAGRLGATILSVDVVRDEIRRNGGDPFDGDRVFNELSARLAERLAGGASVILDATHWQRPYRAYAVNCARASGAKVVAIWFDIPLAVCLRNNETRLGNSPGLRREDPETIRRIHIGLELPSIEDFDEIWRIQDVNQRVMRGDDDTGRNS
ncbi:MAG TPA: ATP-binding protein [Anaerolineae bacterium]|nr:ATP-binding protein [Anaerolineae bacterium]